MQSESCSAHLFKKIETGAAELFKRNPPGLWKQEYHKQSSPKVPHPKKQKDTCSISNLQDFAAQDMMILIECPAMFCTGSSKLMNDLAHVGQSRYKWVGSEQHQCMWVGSDVCGVGLGHAGWA